MTILGPDNLPSTVPHDASQMYARNVCTLLLYLAKGGQDGAKGARLAIDLDDEITRETLVTHDGKVVHPKVRGAGNSRRAEKRLDDR